MFTRKRLTVGLVGAGLLLSLAAPAQASYFSSTIETGVNNYQDQSREIYVDANGDGLFGVGDVLTGFLRIDNKIGPTGIDLQNRVYVIFSQEVKSIGGNAGDVVEFIPVTNGIGLTLSELGVVGAGANDMMALYSTPNSGTQFSTDLIIASPGDRVGSAAVTMADYLDVILTEGTLDLLAGVYDVPSCSGGTTDCFQGDSAAVGGANSNLISLPSSITFANFVAGLETSLDPAGWLLSDTTPSGLYSVPPAGAAITIAEFAITNGAVKGSANINNESEWTSAVDLYTGIYGQCLTEKGYTACGFIDNASLTFEAVRVPEPATLGLLGLGLLGLGATRRRLRRNKS